MIADYLSVLAAGLLPTVELTIGGIILATVISFLMGLGGLSRRRWLRFVVRIYVEGWRGTSELVQLFWIYLVVPVLIGFQIVPLWAGIIVLGLNHGAYGAEIVRGSINSVPKAQQESAIALNFSPYQRMRRVILPQAIVEMLPPFNTLYIQLLKASSLASLINVSELTYQGKSVLVPTASSHVALIFFLLLLMYLALSVIITLIMRGLERVAVARVGRVRAR